MTLPLSVGETPAGQNWRFFVSRLSLLTAVVYAVLILGIVFAVAPISEQSPLPQAYFELIAAARSPNVYRSVIALDVVVYLALAGLFVAFSMAQERQFPFQSRLLLAAAAATCVGFLGACVRISETPRLALAYLNASGVARDVILHDYSQVLALVNVSFSAVGMVEGVALLLIASGRHGLPGVPVWCFGLLGLAGLLSAIKGAFELLLNVDLGPLALVSGLLLVIALLGIARGNWRGSTL